MRKGLLSLLLLVLGGLTFAQPSGLPVDVPREDLFVADQIFRYDVTGNYNLWSSTLVPHRQALMMGNYVALKAGVEQPAKRLVIMLTIAR